MIPQDTVCHIVHIPMPKSIFETKDIIKANNTPAIGPSVKPDIMIIEVTGCTFGIKTKKYRPTIAKAANTANKVILYVFTQIIPKPGNQIQPYHLVLIYILQLQR